MAAFAPSQPCLRHNTFQNAVLLCPRRKSTSTIRAVATDSVAAVSKSKDTVLERRAFGTTGLEMTELVLGTMTWGCQNSEEDAHAQLDYAYDRGVVGIDTAEMYPVMPSADTTGNTERMIGSWVKKRGGAAFRDNLVICSKVAGGQAPGRSFPWIRGEERRVDGRNIREAVDGSLARLGIDYIDLLQIHWPDRYVPMFGAGAYDVEKEREAVSFEVQVAALDELIKEGKIRSFGLSNETAWGVAQFDAIARMKGYARPVSIQNAYNLLDRSFEGQLAEVCAPSNANVPLLVYSALAGGALTGKYLQSDVSPKARFSHFPNYMTRFRTNTATEAIVEYTRIADEAGISLAEMSLAWCRSRWFVGATIIGATSVAQLKQNLDSSLVRIDNSVIRAIDEVYVRYRDPSRTS